MAYSTPNTRYNDIYAETNGPLSMAGLPTVPAQNYGSSGSIMQQPVYSMPINGTTSTAPTTPTTPGGVTPPLPSAPPPSGATVKPPGGYAKPFENTFTKMNYYGSSVGPNPVGAFDSMMGLMSKKNGTMTPEELAANEAYVKDWLMTNYGVSWPAFADGGMVEPTSMNPLQTAAPSPGGNFSISPYGHQPRQMPSPAPGGPIQPPAPPQMGYDGKKPEGDPRGPGGRRDWSPPSFGGFGPNPGMGRFGGYLNDAFSRLPPQMQAPMNRFSTQLQRAFNRFNQPQIGGPLPPYQPNGHGPAWDKGSAPQIGGPLPPTSI